MKRAAPFTENDRAMGASLSSGTSNSTAPSVTPMPTSERMPNAFCHSTWPAGQLNRMPVQFASLSDGSLVNDEKVVRRHSAESATATGPAQVLKGWPEMLALASYILVLP